MFIGLIKISEEHWFTFKNPRSEKKTRVTKTQDFRASSVKSRKLQTLSVLSQHINSSQKSCSTNDEKCLLIVYLNFERVNLNTNTLVVLVEDLTRL